MADGSDERKQRAAAAGLMQAPPNVSRQNPDGTVTGGFSCSSCQFFAKGVCINPKVAMPVLPQWCCNYWNRPGAKNVADILP